MSPEEQMILYSVLQDIADELRRIKRERHEESQEYTAQPTTSDFKSIDFYLVEASYTDQEN